MAISRLHCPPWIRPPSSSFLSPSIWSEPHQCQPNSDDMALSQQRRANVSHLHRLQGAFELCPKYCVHTHTLFIAQRYLHSYSVVEGGKNQERNKKKILWVCVRVYTHGTISQKKAAGEKEIEQGTLSKSASLSRSLSESFSRRRECCPTRFCTTTYLSLHPK